MMIKLQKAMILLNKLEHCMFQSLLCVLQLPGKLLYFCHSESETCWQRTNLLFQQARLLFLLHIFKSEPADQQKANAL